MSWCLGRQVGRYLGNLPVEFIVTRLDRFGESETAKGDYREEESDGVHFEGYV